MVDAKVEVKQAPGVAEEAPMTEQEWLACTDPARMLEFLRGKASDRKLRLFAVACCRQIWDMLTDERSRKAVDVAEGYADGLVSEELRHLIWRDASQVQWQVFQAHGGSKNFLIANCYDKAALAAANSAYVHIPGEDDFIEAVLSVAGAVSWAAALPDARPNATALYGPDGYLSKDNPARNLALSKEACSIRDIFGNPVRPITIDPFSLTSRVTQLAQAIYDERTFDRLPILADALEDAGCASQDMLSHCRELGPHSLGCWAVDMILAKT
jgi:hypothetical protein